jgi:hypothetical protein
MQHMEYTAIHQSAPESNVPDAPLMENSAPLPGRALSAVVVKFAGWWAIFAGLLAMNSVCPICGSASCPVGVGTTGVIAGLFAAAKQWGAPAFRGIARVLRLPVRAHHADETPRCDCHSCQAHGHHLHHHPHDREA